MSIKNKEVPFVFKSDQEIFWLNDSIEWEVLIKVKIGRYWEEIAIVKTIDELLKKLDATFVLFKHVALFHKGGIVDYNGENDYTSNYYEICRGKNDV